MIKTPCPSCGCQYCDATTNSGEKVRIEICRCNDGIGEFEITIINSGTNEIHNEKHQCTEQEIASCLTSRFNVNLDSMSHKCFN